MAETKITSVKVVPATTPGRIGKKDRFVFWQLDGGAVFLTVLPDETFSEAALLEDMKKQVALHAATIGKTFQV